MAKRLSRRVYQLHCIRHPAHLKSLLTSVQLRSLSDSHFGTWSAPTIFMLASFRISNIIASPFPNQQPTCPDGTTRRAITSDLLLNPESSLLSQPNSMDLEWTSTTAFCAGEYLDSGFLKAIIVIIRSSHPATEGPILILAPVSLWRTLTILPPFPIAPPALSFGHSILRWLPSQVPLVPRRRLY